MSESHSSNPPAPDNMSKSPKIAKPREDFPLSPHPAGYWCKRIKGQLHYFGTRWKPGDAAAALAAADAALEDYNRQADALHSGRKPRPDTEALTVKELCNEFLNAKKASVDAGELSPRTWSGYRDVCDLLIAHFGRGRLVSDLGPEDFAELRKKMAAKWGSVRLGNTIQSIRSVFKHGFDNDLIDRPARFGSGFKRPSKKTLRIERAKKGAKLFTRDEVRRMMDGADGQLKAMVLLGINCGYGNADCGTLPLTAIDLDKAVIDFPRPKTGIARRCVLWPETVEALRDVIAQRKEPKDKDAAGLVFTTKYGHAWHRDTGGDGHRAVSHEFGKLLKKLGINGRKGLGFYTLRHTFRTVADEARDQPAADYIMGHEVPHMSSVYRETISDARLRAVVNHVREWLFGDEVQQ